MGRVRKECVAAALMAWELVRFELPDVHPLLAGVNFVLFVGGAAFTVGGA